MATTRKPPQRTSPRQSQNSASMMRRASRLSLPMLTVIGLGAGAAAMYFFDPQAGRRRRASFAQHAGEVFDSSRDFAGQALHGGAGLAGRAWNELSSHAHDAASRIGQAGDDFAERSPALRAASGFRHNMMSRAHDWYDAARSRFAPERPSRTPMVAGFFGSAVGCLVAGAALMFVFDPSRGRARREHARNRVKDFVSRQGGHFREAGRHWADTARGYASRVKSRFAGHNGGHRTDWSDDAETTDDESSTDSGRTAAARSDDPTSSPRPNLM